MRLMTLQFSRLQQTTQMCVPPSILHLTNTITAYQARVTSASGSCASKYFRCNPQSLAITCPQVMSEVQFDQQYMSSRGEEISRATQLQVVRLTCAWACPQPTNTIFFLKPVDEAGEMDWIRRSTPLMSSAGLYTIGRAK